MFLHYDLLQPHLSFALMVLPPHSVGQENLQRVMSLHTHWD